MRTKAARGSATIRLRDVAEQAGVSNASVSRVLNDPGTVSTELRRRVEHAMAQLAYVPNWAARALASQKSRTVGAVVPTLGIAIFARGVEGLQNRLEESGHTLLIASAQYNAAKEAQQIRTLLERKVDGIVLVGNEHSDMIFETIENAKIPVVTTYLHSQNPRFPSVGFDNEAAAERIVEHLVQLGHREFGLTTSPVSQNDRIRARLNGMLRCLSFHGIVVPPERILEVPYSVGDGRRALRDMFSRSPVPTAVACTTDILAVGAILEAQQLGLNVPRDLSITGFDDLDLAGQLIPALTTVHVPADEIGRRAADLILSIMQGRSVPTNIELTVEVMLRSSTAAPMKNAKLRRA